MRAYPSFRQLQYFLALTKTLSFGKAAEECFVTQSTLSSGIKELESLLGQDLFERSSRQVLLTPFGQEFIGQAEILLEQADRVLDFSSNSQSGLAGDIQLGIIPTIAPFYGGELLSKIKKEYPKTQAIVTEGLTDHLLKKLHEGSIDMALLALPYDIKGLDCRIIKDDKFYLLLPKTHPFKHDDITLNQLQQIELVMLEDGHCLSDHAIAACHMRKNNQRLSHNISTIGGMIMLAAAENKGVLITEMMTGHIKKCYPNMRVVSVGSELEKSKIKRDIALVWRKSSNYKDIVRKFL